MSLLGRLIALAALAVVAVAAIGCGKTVIDSSKAEAALEENLRGTLHEKVSAVDCPSGVEVRPGATFQCTVTLARGKTEFATLKILNKDADVEVTGLSATK